MPQEPNDSDLGKFEIMDRSASLQTMLTTLIGGEPSLKHGDIKKKYDDAEKALGDLYDEAARVYFNQAAKVDF
jgi:hypothetical protein